MQKKSSHRHLNEEENQDLRGEKRVLEESVVNEITKRQKLVEELDDPERSYKYHKKRFQRFHVSFALRLCRRLSQRQNEVYVRWFFVLVFFLNKSPIEKTSSEYRFGLSFPLQPPGLQM